MNKPNPDKKPFPWRCSACKEKSVYEDTVAHEVDIEHDGRAYHVKIDRLKAPRCNRCGLVHPDPEASDAITLAFVLQAKLLASAQIRDYRVQAKLTEDELAAALGVSAATVARWESGGQIQTRSLDNLLRLFFGIAQVREILTTQQIDSLPSPIAPASMP